VQDKNKYMYISIIKIISTEMTNIFVCKPMIMKNSIPYTKAKTIYIVKSRK
jgi:hypothetical protein